MAGQSVENSAGHMNNVLTLAHHPFWPKVCKKGAKSDSRKL